MKTLYLLIITIAISSLSANDCIDKAFKSFQKKEYKKAVSELKSCEKDILQSNSDEDIIKLYFGLGRSYLESGNIDSAFKYQLISYNLKKSLGIENNLNLSLNDLGRIYNYIGLPHKSIFLLNNAIKLNLSISNKELLFDNYINLGNTYNDLNFNDSTEKYYILAKDLLNKVNNKEKAKLYNNLAILYLERGEFEGAINYLKTSIELEKSNKLLQLKYITNLDLIYLFQNKFIDSNSILSYSNLAFESNIQEYMSGTQFKLSILNYKDKNSSLLHLKKSISILNESQNYNRSIYYLRLYKLYLKSNNLVYSELLSLENQLQSLYNNRLAKEYGNELKINQESEELINNLQKELYYTNIGFYGMLFIIILLFSSIALTTYAVRKYKLLNKFIELIRNTNRHNLVESRNAKSDLGKLTYMLDQRLQYKGNEQLFIILDKVINNVNNLDNIHISSSNKEAECQILQHQQIMNGQETH